jgi:hypothetical protein
MAKDVLQEVSRATDEGLADVSYMHKRNARGFHRLLSFFYLIVFSQHSFINTHLKRHHFVEGLWCCNIDGTE